MEDGLDALCAHVRYRLGPRSASVPMARLDELTRLVVRHWPHAHLREVERAGGKNHKGLTHAMALVRAQVREQWEARHGVGPIWPMLYAGRVQAIAHVLLELWWQDGGWRQRLVDMGCPRPPN